MERVTCSRHLPELRFPTAPRQRAPSGSAAGPGEPPAPAARLPGRPLLLGKAGLAPHASRGALGLQVGGAAAFFFFIPLLLFFFL